MPNEPWNTEPTLPKNNNDNVEPMPDATNGGYEAPTTSSVNNTISTQDAAASPYQASALSNSQTLEPQAISGQYDALNSLNMEPATQPFAPLAAVSSPIPQPKKSKKKFIIAGLAALFVAVGIGGSAFAYTTYQKPEKVLTDAVTNLIKARAVLYDGDLAYQSKDGSNKLEIRFDGKADRANNSENIDVSLTMNKKTYPLSASFIQDENMTFYLKIDKLKETLKKYQDDGAGLPSAANKLIEKIDGQWIKVTLDDLKEWGQDYVKTQKCVGNIIRTVKNDDAKFKEIADKYSKNPFVTSKGDVQTKDGNLTFELDVNEAKLKAFVKELNDTQLFTQLQKCDKNTYKLNPDDYKKQEVSKDSTSRVKVAVSQWTHELREITSSYSDDSNKGESLLKPIFANEAHISTPKDTISMDELKSLIDELQKELYGDVMARAETSSNTSSANSILKKSEAYYAISSSYPTLAELKKGTISEAKLDSYVAGLVTASTPSASNPDKIQYQPCISGSKVIGAIIRYYDSTSQSVKSLTAGTCIGRNV